MSSPKENKGIRRSVRFFIRIVRSYFPDDSLVIAVVENVDVRKIDRCAVFPVVLYRLHDKLKLQVAPLGRRVEPAFRPALPVAFAAIPVVGVHEHLERDRLIVGRCRVNPGRGQPRDCDMAHAIVRFRIDPRFEQLVGKIVRIDDPVVRLNKSEASAKGFGRSEHGGIG